MRHWQCTLHSCCCSRQLHSWVLAAARQVVSWAMEEEASGSTDRSTACSQASHLAGSCAYPSTRSGIHHCPECHSKSGQHRMIHCWCTRQSCCCNTHLHSWVVAWVLEVVGRVAVLVGAWDSTDRSTACSQVGQLAGSCAYPSTRSGIHHCPECHSKSCQHRMIHCWCTRQSCCCSRRRRS
jgi:hypothetical protein